MFGRSMAMFSPFVFLDRSVRPIRSIISTLLIVSPLTDNEKLLSIGLGITFNLSPGSVLFPIPFVALLLIVQTEVLLPSSDVMV